MKFERGRGPLSEINVTPLVDVMLVLLIIFMVTAPLLQQGIDVNLPVAKGRELPPEERITVTVKRDGSIFIGETKLTTAELKKRLEALRKMNPSVFLKADRDVPYGAVVAVMAEIKESGIEKLGMITEPAVSLR